MSVTLDKAKRRFIIDISEEMVDDIRSIMGHDPAHLLGEIIYYEIMDIREKERDSKTKLDKFKDHLRF